MGGYLLFNIEFKDKKDRDNFEKIFKIKRMFQYIDITYDCFYYPTWMGYAEPREILNKMKKEGIKQIKFLSLDIGTNGGWYDEIKQKGY